jgi:hypothetical protein
MDYEDASLDAMSREELLVAAKHCVTEFGTVIIFLMISYNISKILAPMPPNFFPANERESGYNPGCRTTISCWFVPSGVSLNHAFSVIMVSVSG